MYVHGISLTVKDQDTILMIIATYPMRLKSRVMARTGVLPRLGSGRGGMFCTLIEHSVPTALAGAAQLRGFGNSSCWYVVFVHVLVLKTPSSFKSRMISTHAAHIQLFS